MFNPKHLNVLHDFTKAELEYLIDFSIHLKKLKANRIPHEYLKGQNIALIFDKTSSRTRSAFVVASHDLGAHSETLVKSDIQFGKKESVLDSARVFGSMFDGIMLRVSKQDIVDTFVEHAGLSIWNDMADDVFISPNAKQFIQAENRLHSIKAIMASTNGHLFVPSV